MDPTQHPNPSKVLDYSPDMLARHQKAKLLILFLSPSKIAHRRNRTRSLPKTNQTMVLWRSSAKHEPVAVQPDQRPSNKQPTERTREREVEKGRGGCSVITSETSLRPKCSVRELCNCVVRLLLARLTAIVGRHLQVLMKSASHLYSTLQLAKKRHSEHGLKGENNISCGKKNKHKTTMLKSQKNHGQARHFIFSLSK